MIGRAFLSSVGLLTLILSSGLFGVAQESDEETPLRYARVSGESARVLNLADDKGVEITRPPSGTLFAVYEEHETGWLLGEIPGGFTVWVFGRYLQPTEEADVFEVTRNAVNIRPRPASDVTSFPLPQRLHAGDRVRVLERKDAEKPLTETWVKILSPPGVRAWIRSADTVPLPAGESGAALWQVAVKNAPVAAAPKEAKEDPREVAARQELEAARALFAAEQAKETPDFGAVNVAFQAILADDPGAVIVAEVNQELRVLAAMEKAQSLEAELESERARRTEEALRQQREVWESSRRKDPLGEVFLSRGALTRRTTPDGVPTYFLRFGGEIQAEIFCPNGRYDLELYSGYEIGVLGTEYSGGTSGVQGIQVTRIEVLAKR